MAFVLEDRVVETANNPGQGDFELLGATENNQTFVTGIGNGNTTRYLAIGAEGAEIGVAQVQAGSPDRLLRPGTVKNIDGTTTPINFTGTVTVACIASVEDVPYRDENGDLPARDGRDIGTEADPWRDGHFSREVLIDGEVVYHQGNVVGDVDSGAILEYGSNANGSYRIMADGTEEAWGLVQESRDSSGVLETDVDYPIDFGGSPARYATMSTSVPNNATSIATQPGDDPTTGMVVLIDRNNNTGTFFYWLAIYLR